MTQPDPAKAAAEITLADAKYALTWMLQCDAFPKSRVSLPQNIRDLSQRALDGMPAITSALAARDEAERQRVEACAAAAAKEIRVWLNTNDKITYWYPTIDSKVADIITAAFTESRT